MLIPTTPTEKRTARHHRATEKIFSRLAQTAELGLKFEFFQQFFDPQTVVGGDAFEDAGEGSGFDRMMIGNYLVVFTILLGCYTDMRAFLAIHCIAQIPGAP